MKLIYYLFILLYLAAASLSDARKANEAFERGDYAEAATLYRQALAQDPENARLHFNLGNALYHLGHADEARESYERFRELSESSLEQSFADYNTGRMLIDQGEYDQAVNYFREALRNNPNDADARHNFELALRQQQEESQPEPQDQQEEGDGDGQNDQQQDQQDQDQPDSGQQPDMPQDDDNTQEQQPQPRPNDMTREEAENILDALKQLERELLENMKKESSDPPGRNERDW